MLHPCLLELLILQNFLCGTGQTCTHRAEDDIYYIVSFKFSFVFEIILLFVCGALGALSTEILKDNCLELPAIKRGVLHLGFLGALVLGAATGYLVDHSPITAFCAGSAALALLPELLKAKGIRSTASGAASPACDESAQGPLVPKLLWPFLKKYPISQKFGDNPHWYKPSGYAGHFGLDIAAPWGEAILAIDDGIVLRNGYTAGNGNFAELQHSWGTSLYLHMAEPCMTEIGLMIKRRSRIGICGNTGAVRSSLPPGTPHAGTHLHLSIKIAGVKNKPYKNFCDPLPFLHWGV